MSSAASWFEKDIFLAFRDGKRILGIDRFMSEARAITNMIGNGIACVVVGHWCREVDNTKLSETIGLKKK